MPIKAYYGELVHNFLNDNSERILGVLTREHHHALDEPQRSAWLQQLSILKTSLVNRPDDRIFLEFFIPRMGKRADAVLVSKNILFILEFKINATGCSSAGLDQVEDYALDLKNFHEGSHCVAIVPVLIATAATPCPIPEARFAADLVAKPVCTNAAGLADLIEDICLKQTSSPFFNAEHWMAKGYRPTPTIIQAAEILYRTHSVADISRRDASAENLQETSASVSNAIDQARSTSKKTICFVTGVPGSGKTLAGLNIATRRSDEHSDEHAVFLSGNGPLVDVLRESLARDKVRREKVRKTIAEREVRSFIQNIHHFRDQYVGNEDIPIEKVVVVDEAQRAWTRDQAANFMQRKRGIQAFNMSEPEFLIGVMDRHQDWCTIVCLVGGGQEINTGEAGISEWINALESKFPSWEVHVSPRIVLPEYGSREAVQFLASPRVHEDKRLHLAVSMRSYRAEALSEFVGHVIDNEPSAAYACYRRIQADYPIYLTRDLHAAKTWLRNRARGTERFGLVASSGAQRLRPEGIYIKAAIEPVNWFLNDKLDVRSSYYLEDVATEFAVQGLELDWVGICWDGDFHYQDGSWISQAFKGTKWQSVNDESRRLYLKNAYRVVLTRARQGMILFVPQGDRADLTRPPSFYDGTFAYLRSCGIPTLVDVMP